MHVYLPYPDFVESAGALDTVRLGDQRSDIVRVLDVIHQTSPDSKPWEDHPTVRMWRGHEVSLCDYGLIVCEEWKARGQYDSIQAFMSIETHLQWATDGRYTMEKPSWFGSYAVHGGYQSNLIRKDPVFYKPVFPGVPNDLPYAWPETD